MKWTDLNKGYIGNAEVLRGKNPYEILRINELASVDEIKKAYRSLVKGYHPDIANDFIKANNEEIIKIINSAYEHILQEKGIK